MFRCHLSFRVFFCSLFPSKVSRSLLLGDAAHSTGGTLGQGANSALTDAVVLDELLKATPGRSVVEDVGSFDQMLTGGFFVNFFLGGVVVFLGWVFGGAGGFFWVISVFWRLCFETVASYGPLAMSVNRRVGAFSW